MRSRGFTLLETVLAISIIAMIMGAVFVFYRQSMRMSQVGRERARESQLAAAIIQQISGELRCAVAAGPAFGMAMQGERDSIAFPTTAVPSRIVFLPKSITDAGRPVEHDIRWVEYRLVMDEETDAGDFGEDRTVLGLNRGELRLLSSTDVERADDEDLADDLASELGDTSGEDRIDADVDADVDLGISTGSAWRDLPTFDERIISQRVKYLEFEYCDGDDWLSRWGQTTLPRAVRVIIGFREIPQEEQEDEMRIPWSERSSSDDDMYTVVVPLMVAGG